MRACLVAVAASACTFNPSVEGVSLVDCVDASDCPRGAACVGGLCVSSPLTIQSITATPPSVEAGGSCAFEVSAIHSLGPNRLRFRWAQVLGPRVPLSIDGDRAELTTRDDYVGSYELEVIVSNGVDPPQRARASCVALLTEDAAFAVLGHDGDCSRANPCGGLATALATGARYLYIGVDEGGPADANFDDALDSTFDDREVHGGFLFPDWQRDMTRSRTTVDGPYASSYITCDRCVVSGIYALRVLPEVSTGYAFSVTGTDIQLRELRVELTGGGSSTYGRGIRVAAESSGVSIVGARITVGAGGATGNSITGIEHNGVEATIRDTVVDLRGAHFDNHYGINIEATDALDSRPFLDRVFVRTGDAVDWAYGADLDCVAARVWNSIFITDTLSKSQALRLDGGSICPAGTVIHSSLFIAGAGQTSTAVRIVDQLRSTTLTNSILDAGDGFERRVFDIDDSLDASREYDLGGTVMVLEGGKQPRDVWGLFVEGDEDVAGLEALFACPGCLETADTAAFVDRASDFHLTPESSCCAAAGLPIGAEDPQLDYDGVPRPLPPESPAVGPYELVP